MKIKSLEELRKIREENLPKINLRKHGDISNLQADQSTKDDNNTQK